MILCDYSLCVNLHDQFKYGFVSCTFQSINGYSKAALAEAVFDVDNEIFNEGELTLWLYFLY